MDDIVNQLLDRADGGGETRRVMREAAAEIEELRTEITDLKQRIHWLNEELLRRG